MRSFILQGSSLFNSKPAFGTTTTAASGFGAPANNLFAKPSTGPSLFGATSQPSTFGTSGGFSFGNTTGVGGNYIKCTTLIYHDDLQGLNVPCINEYSEC